MMRRVFPITLLWIVMILSAAPSTSQSLSGPLTEPPGLPTTMTPEQVAQAKKAQAETADKNKAAAKSLSERLSGITDVVLGKPGKNADDIRREMGKNSNLAEIVNRLKGSRDDLNVLDEVRRALDASTGEDPLRVLHEVFKKMQADPTVPPGVRQRRDALISRIWQDARRTPLGVLAAKGTGRTTGHIADLVVTNNSSVNIETAPQTLYIPSDGKYQSYVARIPESLLPPGTSTIPVDGFCSDVHTPPVAMGSPMPPISEWIPVGTPVEPTGDEGVPLITTAPIPPFTPEDIPSITTSASFKPSTPGVTGDIIITWPGSGTPVSGTLDPRPSPEVYAPVVVSALDHIEHAAGRILQSGDFPTPFSGDPPKEESSVIQQMFWVFTAGLTGESYGKDDFTGKVYTQYEEQTGSKVETLPEEEQEKLETGADQFWDAFTAVGVEAKVLGSDSPGLAFDPNVLATVSPQCDCDSISFTLTVFRGRDNVYSGRHSSRKNPAVAITDFKFGDALTVKLSNIRAHCACGVTECLFYPAESTNAGSPGYTTTDRTRPGKVDIEMANDPAGEITDNSNATHKDKTFSADGREYSFTLETKDEGTNSRAVFQKMKIKAYCELEGCRRDLCKKQFTLNFVTRKS